MRVDIKELLKLILRDAGAEILDRNDEFIWAKTSDGLYLYHIEKNVPVDGDYIVHFNRLTEQVSGYKGIICLKGCKSDAMSIAERLGIELTPREEFARIVGEFIIKLAERGEEVPIIQEEDVEVLDVEEEDGDEESEVIPIFLEDIEESAEKIIKPLIPELKAMQLSRESVGGFKAELNLIPYYVFEFSLMLIIEGENEDKNVAGVIAINALTGEYEIWKTGYETVSSISIPHIKVEPKISKKSAEYKALNGLNMEFTTEKEVRIEEENITIIEKRKTRPRKDTIKINFLGLYYFPVWIVTGRRGKIMVNAVSGELIRSLNGLTI